MYNIYKKNTNEENAVYFGKKCTSKCNCGVHQTIVNIMHIFKIQQMNLDNENPWEGILSSTMFGIHSKIYRTTQHKPS